MTTTGTTSLEEQPPGTTDVAPLDPPSAFLRSKIVLHRRAANRCRSWFGVAHVRFAVRPSTRTAQLERRARLKVLRHKACELRWTWANRDFETALRVAVGFFPVSYQWLWNCADSEGGHGAWVPNRQGSGAGGWLQFKYGTFVRMSSAAWYELRVRGVIVPVRFKSWYSPLGQALAGAWGFANGRSHEWSGAGC